MLFSVLGLLFALGCGNSDSSDDQSVVGVGQDERQGDESGAVSVVVANTSGTVTTGTTQRMMAALINNDGTGYRGGPSVAVTLRFAEVEGESEIEIPGTWRSVQEQIGMYVAPVEFPRVGLWEVSALEGEIELGTALFEVTSESIVPNVGDPAPLSETPTAADAGSAGLTTISTDPNPDPAFYQLSVAEAVSSGQPTLIAFATPAFCRTALCGPTMDAVKVATGGRENLNVVHVEPFDLAAANEGDLVANEFTLEWGLPTEPWVFIVGSDGRIVSRFEGLITAEELVDALESL